MWPLSTVHGRPGADRASRPVAPAHYQGRFPPAGDHAPDVLPKTTQFLHKHLNTEQCLMRTCYTGEVNKNYLDQQIRLIDWVHRRRDDNSGSYIEPHDAHGPTKGDATTADDT